MPPRASGFDRRGRRRAGARRLQRFAGLSVVSAVVVITLLLTAFGSSSSGPALGPALQEARPALVSTLPRLQVVATRGPLRLQLPVAQPALTAIGYHGGGDGALRLQPLGRRGNEGLLGRLRDRIFGTGGDSLVWYQLPGGKGPSTSSLAVGAAPGTDVFAPAEGTVVGIHDVVIDRERHGVRVDIQPASAPSLIVSISRLRPDPALTVGSSVTAARSRIGTVLDLSEVERIALAEFTQDAGNHVSIVVRPSATLSLP